MSAFKSRKHACTPAALMRRGRAAPAPTQVDRNEAHRQTAAQCLGWHDAF